MTVEPGWVPPGIDTSKANIARVYDYWLGGHHNFRADQDAARALITVEPNARAIMRANRAFLGRAVRFLAREAGVRQFLVWMPEWRPDSPADVPENPRQYWALVGVGRRSGEADTT